MLADVEIVNSSASKPSRENSARYGPRKRVFPLSSSRFRRSFDRAQKMSLCLGPQCERASLSFERASLTRTLRLFRTKLAGQLRFRRQRISYVSRPALPGDEPNDAPSFRPALMVLLRRFAFLRPVPTRATPLSHSRRLEFKRHRAPTDKPPPRCVCLSIVFRSEPRRATSGKRRGPSSHASARATRAYRNLSRGTRVPRAYAATKESRRLEKRSERANRCGGTRVSIIDYYT